MRHKSILGLACFAALFSPHESGGGGGTAAPLPPLEIGQTVWTVTGDQVSVPLTVLDFTDKLVWVTWEGREEDAPNQINRLEIHTTDPAKEPEMEVAQPVLVIGPGGQAAAPAGSDPFEQPPRENAEPGSVLILNGVEFTFKTDPDPTALFEVLIGPDAEATDRNLLATIKRAAEFVPDEPEIVGVMGEPAPAGASAAPPSFPELFPTIGEWFDRVQKWAQFNGRPIPELGEAFEDAYLSEIPPHEAAESLCQQKTDYATANGSKTVDEPPATA